jgi:dienelactone hydrolase
MCEKSIEAAGAARGERVTFTSGGETLVGRLFPAAFSKGNAPAVAIIGPTTYVKEQAPAQYGPRLAPNGFTALIFDARYRGESGGEPRCLEDTVAKVQDLRAAVAFLAARPDVDADRLAVIGICFGGNAAVHAAADDPLIRAVATVTPHFRNAEADALWLGGEQAVAARLAHGQQALAKYEPPALSITYRECPPPARRSGCPGVWCGPGISPKPSSESGTGGYVRGLRRHAGG